jgi:hypothetical protein
MTRKAPYGTIECCVHGRIVHERTVPECRAIALGRCDGRLRRVEDKRQK